MKHKDMKILHLNTFDSGGAATGAILQHLALMDAGIKTNILFLEGSSRNIPQSSYYRKPVPTLASRILKRAGMLRHQAEIEQQHIRTIGRPYSEGGTYELFSSPYSIYTDLQHHPLVAEADLINLHWISGFVDIPSFLKTLKKPVVWTLHDMFPYLGGFHYDIDLDANPAFSALENKYARIKKETLSTLHYAVAGNSRWNTGKAAESEVFRNARSFQTIGYPVDTGIYRATTKPLAAKCLGLPEGHLILGFACENLNNPRKGLDLLIAALNRLPADVQSKICCLSFGRENPDIRLESVRMIQLGTINQPQLKSIVYSAMDYFIIPSRAEAFGLTAIEAMACGTPVLAANTGGLPEIVQDNTGFIFAPDHIESLLECLLNAFHKSAGQRQQMADHAIEEMQHYTPHHTASQYISLYENLLSTWKDS